jgi:hypothetical protein
VLNPENRPDTQRDQKERGESKNRWQKH